jgi:hypothetical protein
VLVVRYLEKSCVRCLGRSQLESYLVTQRLETIFQQVQTLQETASELPQSQQAIFTNTLENLSNYLQNLAASRQFEIATNNAAKVVKLENLNRIL